MRRLLRRAWPALAVVLTLWPALMVALEGRNVNDLDFSGVYAGDSIVALAGRIGTLIVLGLAVLTIASSPSSRGAGGQTRPVTALVFALVAFGLGYTVLPSFFGAVPAFEVTTVYAFLVLFAAVAARRRSLAPFLSAVKGSLLALMLASLAAAILMPEASVQTQGAELRLPGVGFRLWGLGSSPNNIAPLALLLILLTIHAPFARRALTLTAFASASIVILLSQSQTTWAAALLVLPAFALYSVTPKPFKRARISPHLAVLTLVGMAAGLSILIWQAAHFDFTGLTNASIKLEAGQIVTRENSEDIGTFTGRADIWNAAIDVWRDNPWFGYGPTAWDLEFRNMTGLSFAFNAHNQVMQSVSVGGWAGLIGLTVYLMALLSSAIRNNRRANGLTLALICVIVIRGTTEGPFDTNTLLSGELLFHMVTLALVVHYASAPKVMESRRSRRRRRVGGKGVVATVG